MDGSDTNNTIFIMANLADKYKTILTKNWIHTPLRKSHFFTQLAHESGLVAIAENLYYTTIKAARNAFYTPFKGKSDSFVTSYLRNPEKMANYVYANRMGNGNEASGEGWKFRGRGFMMTTGKSNYEALSKSTGIDYVDKPDLLLNESDAMISAIFYWNSNYLSKFADADDLDAISDIVNIGKRTKVYGDANGFKDRKELLAYYKKIF